jgi:hypothetical protein
MGEAESRQIDGVAQREYHCAEHAAARKEN